MGSGSCSEPPPPSWTTELRSLGKWDGLEQLLGLLDQAENRFLRTVRIDIDPFCELFDLSRLTLDVAQRSSCIPDLGQHRSDAAHINGAIRCKTNDCASAQIRADCSRQAGFVDGKEKEKNNVLALNKRMVQVGHDLRHPYWNVGISLQAPARSLLYRRIPASKLLDFYASSSLSAVRASLGIGMVTITEVPEPFDSIFICPWN